MTNLYAMLKHPAVMRMNACDHPMTKSINLVNQRLFEVTIANGSVADREIDIGGIDGVRPIEIEVGSAGFIFSFLDFITYAVTEEMFAQNIESEIGRGGRVCIFSKSCFLDFVENTTWATSDYPGPLIHDQINTLDHKIDIVTAAPPEIRDITAKR